MIDWNDNEMRWQICALHIYWLCNQKSLPKNKPWDCSEDTWNKIKKIPKEELDKYFERRTRDIVNYNSKHHKEDNDD